MRHINSHGPTFLPIVICIVAIFILCGCASHEPGAIFTRDSVSVPVFVVTDRKPINSDSTDFGAARSTDLSYAAINVEIPKGHWTGQLGESSWKTKPFLHGSGPFWTQVSEQLAKSQRHSVLVFVHGFNVPFRDAVLNAAQVHYDLGFDGPIVLYSWPSQGTPDKYLADEDSAYSTVDHLHLFLSDLVSNCAVKAPAASTSPANPIHIDLIAHSMGCRALTLALLDMRCDCQAAETTPFDQVILAAPDVDAYRFRYQDIQKLRPPATSIAGAVEGTSQKTGLPVMRGLTIYGSSEDLAIRASKMIHSDARLGEGKQDIVVVPGAETIDASRVDTGTLGDFFRHSYWSDSPAVIRDIAAVLNDQRPGSPARSAQLKPITKKDADHKTVGTYWDLKPLSKTDIGHGE